MKIKRIIMYILVVMSLAACGSNLQSYEKEEGKYYFRDSIWGMKPSDIEELEGRKADEDNVERFTRSIAYKDIQVNDIQATAYYGFDNNNDELFSGRYLFNQERESVQSYLEDFNTLDAALTDIYGEPMEKQNNLLGDYDKNSMSDCAKALENGDLSYHRTWESENTEIRLSIANRIGIELRLFYCDLLRQEDYIQRAHEIEFKEMEEREEKEIQEKRGESGL